MTVSGGACAGRRGAAARPSPGARLPPVIDWLQRGTIYHVYPRSFQDADGDGVGDLAGVRARLPYLARLGVDAVWLSPFYRSPMADFGYDFSDHRDVIALNLTGEERAVALGGRAGQVVMSARGERDGTRAAGAELRLAGDDAVIVRLDGRAG